MSISAVNAVVSHAASLTSPKQPVNTLTKVTSSDPTVLTRQAKQVTNAITQLRGSNGNPQQIQKLQLALQMINDKIREHAKQVEQQQQSSSQQAHSVNSFARHVDLKA